MKYLNTPVVLTLWNNPKAIAQIMQVLSWVKPKTLYLISDGARTPKENKLITKSKQLAQNPNWKCQVITDYTTKNYGPKYRVSSGITNFYQKYPTGIVLEHDCLPDTSFFSLCEYLLNKYENDSRIMHISGNNFQSPTRQYDGSYYFSLIPHIWGFATWARAWKKYNVEIDDLDDFKQQQIIQKLFTNKLSQRYWLNIFWQMANNKIDTWDFQWTYTVFKNKGICINPAKNLVTNIGFGPQAANTKDQTHSFAHLPLESIIKIIDPPQIQVDQIADNWTMKHNFQATPYHMAIKPLINRLKGICLLLTDYQKYQQIKSS